MNRLRFLPLALVLLLLPSLAHSATNAGGQKCQPSFLSQLSQPLSSPAETPSLNQNPAPVEKGVSFCAQYYCPGTAPVVQCNCACDAEECLCAEACAPGDFRCPQRCRNALNNCYVACQELY